MISADYGVFTSGVSNDNVPLTSYKDSDGNSVQFGMNLLFDGIYKDSDRVLRFLKHAVVRE